MTPYALGSTSLSRTRGAEPAPPPARPILMGAAAAGRVRRRQTRVVALLACALGLTVTGCASDHPSTATTAADCSSQVRRDGVVYTGYGDARTRPIAPVGTADLADCEDVGSDPGGSVFRDDPPQVRVWSVRGYPVDEVLFVRWPHDRLELFAADSLSSRQRDRVLRDLLGRR